MAKRDVIANLVANMELQSAQFQKEMARVEARTKGYTRTAKAANDANYKLEGSFRRAANSTAILYGPLNGLSGRLSYVATGIGAVGAVATTGAVALAGFAVVVGQSVSVAEEYERSLLRTEALIKSTGSAAGFTAEQLRAQAQEQALATLAGVQDVEKAQQVLLTFKTINGDIYKDAIGLSADLAAVMGSDMKAAALQLGKALEDPATGLTALKRSGVSFTDSERATIATMQQSGQVAEAQALILEKLRKQVGGAAGAEAGGLAGAVDTLSQRWDEWLISIDNTLGASTGLTYFFNRIANGIKKSNDALFGSQEVVERSKQLWDEYAEIEKKLSAPRGRYRPGLLRRQEEIRKEIDAINAGIIAEGEAYKKGLLEQKKIREQAEQDRIIAANEISQKRLENLEIQLASEEEKLKLQSQKRLDEIADLQLSQQEIEARGFETIEQLRADLFLREEEQLDEHLLAIQSRRDREVELEQEKQDRILESEKKTAELKAYIRDQERISSTEGFLADLQSATAHSKKLHGIHKAAAISQSVMNTYQAANQALAAPFPWPIPQIFAGTAIAAGLANVAQIRATPIASYDGGGYTGNGARVGGVDGKGGMYAIVHPQETIVDHTKGQRLVSRQTEQNVAVNYHFHGDAEQNERMLNNNRNATIRDARRLTSELGRPY